MIFSISLCPLSAVSPALQSVQVCEREAWLGRAGAALSGQERVEFLKVVTDDEPDDQLDKRFFQNNSNADFPTKDQYE